MAIHETRIDEPTVSNWVVTGEGYVHESRKKLSGMSIS